MVVELEFTAFNTRSGWDVDTLTILDNDGTVLSKEISGDCLPPKMWSRTNVVHLRFVTDGYGTRTGWSANWASVATTGHHSNMMRLKVQKEGICSYICPLHFQLWKEGRQLTTESLQLPGMWGEVNVRGNGNCTLRPACELSGTKCCDSGELLIVFCSCIAYNVCWYQSGIVL